MTLELDAASKKLLKMRASTASKKRELVSH
jgi:hypothetical protein